MMPQARGPETALPEAPVAEPTERAAALERALEALSQLAEDASVPRNIRRGAQSARDSVAQSRAALDVRIATAVSALDDLANAPNLPSHGRTALWSVLSSLESVP
ncbi:MAG: UPF0147 family protein [Thermoplasmata archaeon]|jgi:uncharacterized protein (UPF0147 family)